MAYVVAVAFYLSLLSHFFLNYLGIESLIMERALTTAIILFIAGVGYVKTYYFLQTVLAIIYNFKDNRQMGRAVIVDQVLFTALAIILGYVIIFSIPAG